MWRFRTPPCNLESGPIPDTGLGCGSNAFVAQTMQERMGEWNHSAPRRDSSGGLGGRNRAMNPRHYVDLKETSRDLQPTHYFMINCLLYSRMETGLVSNQDFYDEDVNVYLAHLLHSFITPEYVDQSRKFLSKYDTDVFRRMAHSSDARLKYLIYKTNAAFLLVSIRDSANPLSPPARG